MNVHNLVERELEQGKDKLQRKKLVVVNLVRKTMKKLKTV